MFYNDALYNALFFHLMFYSSMHVVMLSQLLFCSTIEFLIKFFSLLIDVLLCQLPTLVFSPKVVMMHFVMFF